MWTQFWDMNSGGGQKEDYAMIYIEAPEEEAKLIFYNRFGHNPERVSCTCCGGDYSISSGELDQLTAFHRGCKFERVKDEAGGGHYVEEADTKRWARKYLTIKEYLKSDGVLAIYAKDIKPEERQGTVPDEGYIWV